MPTNTPVATARQPIGREAGVLQRFPADFQQQALLRIHRRRLARRDAEELRVEAVDAVEKSATPRDHLAGRLRIGIVVGVGVPAIGRHLADRVHAVADQPPQIFGSLDATGVATAGSDDRDWLAARALTRIETGLQALDRGQRFLKEVATLAHRARSSRASSRASSSSSESSSRSPVAGSATGTGEAADGFVRSAPAIELWSWPLMNVASADTFG